MELIFGAGALGDYPLVFARLSVLDGLDLLRALAVDHAAFVGDLVGDGFG